MCDESFKILTYQNGKVLSKNNFFLSLFCVSTISWILWLEWIQTVFRFLSVDHFLSTGRRCSRTGQHIIEMLDIKIEAIELA